MSEKTKTVTSKKEVTVEVAFIACYRLVVVPVALVCSVAVAIVQVINMIAVRDGNVAAALAMLVIVASDMRAYEALTRELFAENDCVAAYASLIALDRVKVDTGIVIPAGV